MIKEPNFGLILCNVSEVLMFQFSVNVFKMVLFVVVVASASMLQLYGTVVVAPLPSSLGSTFYIILNIHYCFLEVDGKKLMMSFLPCEEKNKNHHGFLNPICNPKFTTYIGHRKL